MNISVIFHLCHFWTLQNLVFYESFLTQNKLVRTANSYGLDGQGIGVRFLAGTRNCSHQNLQTGYEAHPASYQMDREMKLPMLRMRGTMLPPPLPSHT
jgi:hypothetical protein